MNRTKSSLGDRSFESGGAGHRPNIQVVAPIRINKHEDLLAGAREHQADDGWQKDYRATRPKVERKLAHLVRRKYGGRGPACA